MFLSFEGLDGSGKTTQIAQLADYLRARGYEVVTGREPGGTPIGDQVRDLLHDPENTAMAARTEFLLYAASRAQLVAEVIRPALTRNAVVIVDRYIDSTFAYQGYGRQLDLDLLRRITEFATGGLKPARTIYLQVDAATGLVRRQSAAAQGAEWNRLDAEALEFHERVQHGYEELIAAEPERFIRIDGAMPPDQVQAAIRSALESFLTATPLSSGQQ